MKSCYKNKIAQVWVETVIYTLIALVLMGTVIAFAKPKIEQMQDKAITEQSLEIMSQIDSEIKSVMQNVEGNKRVLDVGLKKGSITIDGENDKIFFEIESKNMYSEPDKDVPIGGIIVRTEQNGKLYDVTLSAVYSNYDLTYNGEENAVKTITKSSTPYKIVISNEGKPEEGGEEKVNIQIS